MRLLDSLAAGITGAPSGSAVVYQRATLTPAVVYGDFEGLTVLSQPLGLDGNGAIAAYVGGVVDVLVSDSGGAQVRAFTAGEAAGGVEVRSPSFTGVDYVTGVSAAGNPTDLATVLDRLVASFGSTDFNVSSGGSGIPLSQFVASVNANVINVKNAPYLAQGDGTTNDTVAIAAALADAEGRVLYFPAGTYLVDSTITIDLANVILRGDGSEVSVIRQGVAGFANLISCGASSRQRVAFQDLGFSAADGVSTAVISANSLNGGDYEIDRCLFDDALFTGELVSFGSSFAGNVTARVRDCQFVLHPNTNSAILNAETSFISRNMLVSGCDFDVRDGYSDTIVEGPGIALRGCNFFGDANDSADFVAVAPGSGASLSGSVVGCVFCQSGANNRMTAIALGTTNFLAEGFVESENQFVNFANSGTSVTKIYSVTHSSNPVLLRLGSREGLQVGVSTITSSPITLEGLLAHANLTVTNSGAFVTALTMVVPANTAPVGSPFTVSYTNTDSVSHTVTMTDAGGFTSESITVTAGTTAVFMGRMISVASVPRAAGLWIYDGSSPDPLGQLV